MYYIDDKLYVQRIGDGWITDLYELKKILPFAKKLDFIEEVQVVKRVCILLPTL